MRVDSEFEFSAGIEQYEKKIYDQRQLIQISKALNSNLDLNSLIESILNISLAQGQTLQVGIYLNPEINNRDFYLHENSIGFDLSDGLEYKLSYKGELVKLLGESDQAYTLKAIAEVEQLKEVQPDKELKQLKTLNDDLLIIPLRSKGCINGIIVLGPKTDGTDHSSSEQAFLADLASIAAIAVENARLYEMATVDMMTKLKIYHYFKTRLIDEIELAKLSGRPLSLYITDIDHFKAFNDTYGHQTGNIVLGEVANQLIKNSRSVDIASRYGGEEFAVILPNTSLKEAQRQAERARKSVEEMIIKNPNLGTSDSELKVTISAGVAQFNPVSDENIALLIEKCDRALYRAKDGGRNRTEIASI